MVRDITTDEQLRPHADEFGDVATVEASDNVVQQIRLAVTRELSDVQTTATTTEQRREIRRGINDALGDLSYVDRVIAVKIDSTNDETLSVEIQTASEDYQLTL